MWSNDVLQKEISSRLFAEQSYYSDGESYDLRGCGLTKARTSASIWQEANTGKRSDGCNWPSVLLQPLEMRKGVVVVFFFISHVLKTQTDKAQAHPSRSNRDNKHTKEEDLGGGGVLLQLVVLKSKSRELLCVHLLQLWVMLGIVCHPRHFRRYHHTSSAVKQEKNYTTLGEMFMIIFFGHVGNFFLTGLVNSWVMPYFILSILLFVPLDFFWIYLLEIKAAFRYYYYSG